MPARSGEVDATEVIYQCVESGVNQLLFIVDTCRPGTGVGEANAIASAWLEETSLAALPSRSHGGAWEWAGVAPASGDAVGDVAGGLAAGELDRTLETCHNVSRSRYLAGATVTAGGSLPWRYPLPLMAV